MSKLLDLVATGRGPIRRHREGLPGRPGKPLPLGPPIPSRELTDAIWKERQAKLNPKESRLFPRRHQRGGKQPIVPPGVVMDGIRGLDFRPRTLFVGTRGRQDRSVSVDSVPGDLTWQVEGLHYGFPYRRRFQLGAFRQVMVDLTGFTDVRTTVLGGDLEGLDAITIATVHSVPSAGAPQPVTYAMRLAPGTYPVPDGAFEVYASSPAPTWRWESFDWASGTVISLTDVLGVGVRVPVRGAQFSHAEAPTFDMVWRIEL